MSRYSVWKLLGIEPTDDREQIRRAYTRKLKVTNPEDDPAAFQRLREAYEGALRLAAQNFALAAVDTELDEPDASEDLPKSDLSVAAAAAREAAVPQAVLDVQEDYRRLSELLDRDASSAAALQLFAKISADPALEDLSLRVSLERSIATLLLGHMPQSGELLLRAARAFNWFTQRSRIGTASAIIAAAECARNVAFLEELRGGKHELSAAFRALTRPPVGWQLRVRSLVSGFDEQVRKVQHLLLFELASTSVELNPDAVAWWTAYFAKPRLSRAMVVASLLVPICVGWATSGPLQWSADRSWGAVFAALAAMIAATAVKLVVFDWGRVRLGERFGSRAPVSLRLGWLPLAMLLAIVAACGLPLWPVSALCVPWAWYTRPQGRPVLQQRSLPLLIMFNIPIVAWLLLLGRALPWTVVLTIACLPAAQMAGQLTLTQAWHEVASSARARAIAGLLIVSIVLGAALIVVVSDRKLYGLLATIAVIVVVLQRTAVDGLNDTQLHARYYVSWASMIFIGIGFAALDSPGAAVVMMSVWFLFGTAVGLLMALRNEARLAGARRRKT